MADKPQRAAIYARISDDREGRAAGVERQIPDGKAQAERLGWTLHPTHPVYVDNDISASTRSRKRRPAYDALMAAVRAGEVDGIVYYSTSRLTRRPREFEDVIQLVEETGVKLAAVTSGDVNLTTADGRMMARWMAAGDAAESERIGERVSRAFAQRREAGKPHATGLRPFGFETGGEIVCPDEADAIRSGCKILVDGGSLGDVMKAWNERGITTTTGKRWSRVLVRKALIRPRIAGLVEHNPHWDKNAAKGDPVLTPGDFEAIVDEPTWRAVKAAISDRSRLVQARYGGREHLLSGFIWCGLCGNRMKVSARRDERGEVRPDSFVACQKDSGGCGGVKRNLMLLERYVSAVVERRLADVRPIDPEIDDTADGQEFARLTAQRETITARIDALREQFNDPDSDLDPKDYIASLRGLRERLAEIEATMSGFEQPTQVSDLGPDALAVWRDGTLEERREILEVIVAQIILHPIGKVGPVRARAMVPATTDILLN
jgi:DNA invertase Pin-like site-specific DNA recombinase